jgi:glycosyltransferase involved in cell wall biosynthesis
MIIARLTRTPFVLQPHGALDTYHLSQGEWIKKAYLRIVDGFGLGGARRAVYSSTMEAEEGQLTLRRLTPALIPLGVDPTLFDVPRKETGDLILFLARVAKKKRLDLVLRAMAIPPLSQTGARLIVAGAIGSDLPYIPKQLVEKLGLESRVEFSGQVDRSARRHLLGEASVFVLASDDESFGVAVAEAMAAGCAVVASDHVGLAADAADSGALQLSSQDPVDLSKKIADLIESSAARALIGTAGRKFARDNFDWDGVAQKLESSYVDVLREPR